MSSSLTPSSQSIQVRPFQTAEVSASAVKALVLRVQIEEYGINDPAHLQDLDDVDAAYTRGGGGLWVAVAEDGSAVGTIALKTINDASAGMIKRLYVNAAYRGEQPYGTARKLMEALLTHSRQQGIRNVYLGARIEEPSPAARFFLKHGFVLAAREDVPAGAPISEHDTHFYVRVSE